MDKKPDCVKTVARVGDQLLGLRKEVPGQRVDARKTRGIQAQEMPAHDIEGNEVRCRDDAAFDGDQLTSLWPGLLRMAALQIAGEDDPRTGLPNHFPRVDMAECEIVIALVHEYIH